MAIHIKVPRAKAVKETIKDGVNFVDKHPAALSSTALAVSTANLITNKSRHDKDKKYQDRQLKAMDKLSNQLGKTAYSMNKVNESLKDNDKKKGRPILKFPTKR